MDNHTPEQRKKNMQAIRNKNSKIEILLRKELWARGLHYQKNSKKVFGHPDLVFLGKKVAVFCDSEFWHGYDWETKKHEIKSNQDFWTKKIEKNIERDQIVNQVLREEGWVVIRFWGSDIKKDCKKCADKVEEILIHRNGKQGD